MNPFFALPLVPRNLNGALPEYDHSSSLAG